MQPPLDQGAEDGVGDGLHGEEDEEEDAGHVPRAAGRLLEQVGRPLLLLPAGEQGDEVGEVAGREQQAQRHDGGGARPRHRLGDDGQHDVEDGDGDAAQLRLLEEGGAEDGHGGEGEAGEDEVEEHDGGAGVREDAGPDDQGGHDPAGQVDGREGEVVRQQARGLGLPAAAGGHHGLDQGRHARLALGGDEAGHVVDDADEADEEGDAEPVHQEALVGDADQVLALLGGQRGEGVLVDGVGEGERAGGVVVVVVATAAAARDGGVDGAL